MVAAKQLFEVDAAGIMLADAQGRLRWASASDPLAQTLEDNQETFAAGPCLEAFTTGRPVVMREATLEPRWGEITLTFVELQIRSGLSVPVELGGGPIGTLDVYAAAPAQLGWSERLRLGVGHASTVRPDPSTLGAVGERGSRREGRWPSVPGSSVSQMTESGARR